MRAIPSILTAAGLAAMLYGASSSAITLDEFVERHDLDGNGLLAVEEVTAGPLLDRNGDGIVDRDELAAVASRLRSFRWVNPLAPGETYPGVRQDRPPLPILIWLGDRDFNYAANLEYMGFLYALGIPFERLILPGIGHSREAFATGGVAVMKFHERNFAAAQGL